MAKIFKADFLKMVKMQLGPFGTKPSTDACHIHSKPMYLLIVSNVDTVFLLSREV